MYTYVHAGNVGEAGDVSAASVSVSVCVCLCVSVCRV